MVSLVVLLVASKTSAMVRQIRPHLSLPDWEGYILCPHTEQSSNICCFSCFAYGQETCLVEAFNLRAAIEHTRKNSEMAVEALSDMPPRREQELDPVTLHNQVSSYICRVQSTVIHRTSPRITIVPTTYEARCCWHCATRQARKRNRQRETHLQVDVIIVV